MKGKNISIYFDGTWEVPDTYLEDGDESTNVYRLYKAALDSGETHCLYINGVGNGWYSSQFGGWFGLGIRDKVITAYQYLARNYVDGDNVFLFGYSRGGYSARALSGVLSFAGLSASGMVESTAIAAWEAYRSSNTAEGNNLSFMAKYNSKVIPIQFLGVFDTVRSMGAPLPFLRKANKALYVFHDNYPASNVKNAYQALALDETRPSFEQNLWCGSRPGQNMEQVWFSGSHADIGGGYLVPKAANIVLHEMAMKAIASGLLIGLSSIPAVSDYNSKATIHDSYVKSFGGVYKLFFSRVHRIVTLGDESNQSIHPSVRYREENTNYTPKAVIK